MKRRISLTAQVAAANRKKKAPAAPTAGETPGTPGTPGKPGKPGKPGTPGKPATPDRPATFGPLMTACRSRLADCHERITQLQDALCDSGTANDPTSCALRRAIADEKLPLERYTDRLYREKERLFALPRVTDADLDTLRTLLRPETPEHPENPATPATPADPVILSHKIESLRASLRYYNRLLNYQQGRGTSGMALNPMPDCPRRREIEATRTRYEAELRRLLDLREIQQPTEKAPNRH